MEALGLSQKIAALMMRQLLRLVSIAALLSLSGCSWAQTRMPWHLPDDRGTTIERQPSKEAVSEPRLIEPEPSGIMAASSRELMVCDALLDLPKIRERPADPSNFGKRITVDAWGRQLVATPQLIVIHETVVGENETLSLFATPHPRDEDQASYHMLIGRDGSRTRVVADSYRAYGAGMSAFGDITQRTKASSLGSINNIALHISLVSPDDGRDDRDMHSGYTDAQYRSLAGQLLLWQAAYGIPMTRVTTHHAVDRSRSRYDPRSFRWDRFDGFYRRAATSCGFKRFDTLQAGL